MLQISTTPSWRENAEVGQLGCDKHDCPVSQEYRMVISLGAQDYRVVYCHVSNVFHSCDCILKTNLLSSRFGLISNSGTLQ